MRCLTKKSSYFYSGMKMFQRFFPVLLFVWHLFFAWVAYGWITNSHGDATRYWFVGQDLADRSWVDYWAPGTDVVKIFTFPWVKYLHLPFLGGFLLFSMISFAALLSLYRMMMNRAGENQALQLLVYLLMLLPNLHFWTSLIGKESLLLVPLIILCGEINRKNFFSWWVLAALIFIAVIRPHVAFILLLSYVIGLLFTVPFSLKKKLVLVGSFVIFTGIFTFLLTRIQDFSGGFQRVLAKYEAHIRYFKTTDAYVPLDRYPLPYKIFTFYFRPLPFEKEGLFYTVIGIENIILLLLFGLVVFYSVKYFGILKSKMIFVFPLLFLLFFALMYVYAYANYGIIMRTKVMAMPFLYIFVVEILSEKGKTSLPKNTQKQPYS